MPARSVEVVGLEGVEGSSYFYQYWPFLFCIDCDKVVTIEERRTALDEWKRNCLSQLGSPKIDPEIVEEEVRRIQTTELTEFPR